MQNNCDDIKNILNLVFEPGDIFEIRCLDATTSKWREEHPEAGYFTYENIDKVINDLNQISARGVYFTPNPVHPDLLARSANRIQQAKRNTATTDADILKRRWLLVDCDPVRRSGISSTDAEHDAALYKAMEISEGMASLGWPKPIMLDSGNGAQLMYKIDLPADDDGLIKKCLDTIAESGDDKVKIDTSVHNPARIWRIPGTWNRKGDETDDRKHRQAKIISLPDNLEIVTFEQLQALAGEALQPGTVQPDSNFYIESWISEYCPEAEGPTPWKDGRKWVLPVCPFNPEHTNRSAVITEQANGAIGFTCHHNSCQGNDWHALRELKGDSKPQIQADREVNLSELLSSLGCNDNDIQQNEPKNTVEESTGNQIIKPLNLMIESFPGLNPPVIHGLLREGETMNVIASPKVGKSWFAMHLAIAVASGIDWFGFPVEQGGVLHLDNELFENTLTDRYQKMGEALKINHRLYSHNIDVMSMRGKLKNINLLGDIFRSLPVDKYKLTILDAFYRTLPHGTDENDNAAIADIYNRIDHYADSLNCAFVLIHHSSKGSQTAKSVTDVGAGAGAQSRAADTHLIIRPHEFENIFVMESAIRSWAPLEPISLQWQWPLFIPVKNIDVSKLLIPGKNKTSAENKIPTLEEFVDNCVAAYDPCSERSVIYEAENQYGISERKAKDMFALAIDRGLCRRIRVGSKMQYVKNRDKIDGDKGLWVAALLANEPNLPVTEIAEITGVSRQYIYQIKHDSAP